MCTAVLSVACCVSDSVCVVTVCDACRGRGPATACQPGSGPWSSSTPTLGLPHHPWPASSRTSRLPAQSVPGAHGPACTARVFSDTPGKHEMKASAPSCGRAGHHMQGFACTNEMLTTQQQDRTAPSPRPETICSCQLRKHPHNPLTSSWLCRLLPKPAPADRPVPGPSMGRHSSRPHTSSAGARQVPAAVDMRGIAALQSMAQPAAKPPVRSAGACLHAWLSQMAQSEPM